MNCGGEYGKYLSNSIESGLISEDEINVNLKRILRSGLLGDFDPQHMVPYAKILKM